MSQQQVNEVCNAIRHLHLNGTVYPSRQRVAEVAGLPIDVVEKLTQFRMFRIGHSAYSGANAGPVYVDSRGAAIRELRKRGVKRDDARKAVKYALNGSFSCARCGWETVELGMVSSPADLDAGDRRAAIH